MPTIFSTNPTVAYPKLHVERAKYNFLYNISPQSLTCVAAWNDRSVFVHLRPEENRPPD